MDGRYPGTRHESIGKWAGKWKARWVTGGEPNTEVGRRVLLSLVVSQCNSLGRHFEVNDGGSWCGVSSQCLGSGFGDGLWPSERLHVHRVDEEHVAGWKKPTQGAVMGARVGGDDPQVLSLGQGT